MFAFKLIVTALAVISIFNRSIANHEDEEDNKSDTDVKIENLPTTVTSHDTTEETADLGHISEENEDEMLIDMIKFYSQRPVGEKRNRTFWDEVSTNFVINKFDLCKNLLETLYEVEDSKAYSNFYKGYNDYNHDVIRLFFEVVKLHHREINKPILEKPKLQQLHIQISIDYFHFMIENHGLDLSQKDNAPKKFCIDKSNEVYGTLEARLKKIEKSPSELADVCKGLMKTVGIEDPDNATINIAFEKIYIKLYDNVFTYEGMTSIGLDDEKVTMINKDKANRQLVMYTLDLEDDHFTYNKHTIQERYDLELYISMFLETYFTYFLQIVKDSATEESKKAQSVTSYCNARGVDLISKSNIDTETLLGSRNTTKMSFTDV